MEPLLASHLNPLIVLMTAVVPKEIYKGEMKKNNEIKTINTTKI
jgi:hypothetical protein